MSKKIRFHLDEQVNNSISEQLKRRGIDVIAVEVWVRTFTMSETRSGSTFDTSTIAVIERSRDAVRRF